MNTNIANERISLNPKNNPSILIDTYFISKYYGWSEDKTKQVQYEYERFLILRNENLNLSPSNDIDRFWHAHILNTKSYYLYCVYKFGKLVHHNPAESLDQYARDIRFKQTLVEYDKKFTKQFFPSVWESYKKGIIHSDVPENSKLTNSKLTDSKLNKNLEQLNVPNYDVSDLANSNEIKIFIFYSFDIGYSRPQILEGIQSKSWKPNDNQFDSKTIKINENETKIKPPIGYNFNTMPNSIHYNRPMSEGSMNKGLMPRGPMSESSMSSMNSNYNSYFNNYNSFWQEPTKINEIKNIISEKTGHPVLAIKINPHPNNVEEPCKFFIAELIEMTQNGFC